MQEKLENDEFKWFIFGYFSRRGEKRNKFIVNIRTTTRNGLLIWMNQGPTLQGDFLAVAVIDGKVELSFNLGKQTKPVRIISDVSTYVCRIAILKSTLVCSKGQCL